MLSREDIIVSFSLLINYNTKDVLTLSKSSKIVSIICKINQSKVKVCHCC